MRGAIKRAVNIVRKAIDNLLNPFSASHLHLRLDSIELYLVIAALLTDYLKASTLAGLVNILFILEANSFVNTDFVPLNSISRGDPILWTRSSRSF
jgi:hypothetical protein